MLIAQVELRRSESYWTVHFSKLNIESPACWCFHGVKEVLRNFEIPDSANTIWIKVFSKPGKSKWREPIGIEFQSGYPTLVMPKLDYYFSSALIDKLLREVAIQAPAAFLEVWYQ